MGVTITNFVAETVNFAALPDLRLILAQHFRTRAERELRTLDPLRDWEYIQKIERVRDEQLADIEALILLLSRPFHEEAATAEYVTAFGLLESEGPESALKFLRAGRERREVRLKMVKRLVRVGTLEIRGILHESLMEASMLEAKGRFGDAEDILRQVLASDASWITGRLAFVRFICRSSKFLDAEAVHPKLLEAEQACRDALLRAGSELTITARGELYSALGSVLETQARTIYQANAREAIAAAVQAHREALKLFHGGAERRAWANASTALGSALAEHARFAETGDQANSLLEEAIEAHRTALTLVSRVESPALWSSTYDDLGIALRARARGAPLEQAESLLTESVTAHREALSLVDRSTDPWAWVRGHNRIGAALLLLGERCTGPTSEKILEEAVMTLRRAVEISCDPDMPMLRASIHGNLGMALWLLGKRKKGSLGLEAFRESVFAYECALTQFQKAITPLEWAQANNNLGLALTDLALCCPRAEAARLLVRAVDAERAALEIRTSDGYPQGWAASQNNLAAALEALSSHCSVHEAASLLSEAETAVRNSLLVYTSAIYPFHYRIARETLSRIDSAKRRLPQH